jgi:hypothetical protein
MSQGTHEDMAKLIDLFPVPRTLQKSDFELYNVKSSAPPHSDRRLVGFWRVVNTTHPKRTAIFFSDQIDGIQRIHAVSWVL